MLGRQDHEGGAEKSVGPGGVDANRVAGFGLEIDLGAVGAADPVGLHDAHFLGPGAAQQFEVVEQTVGVVGDLQEPLFEVLLFDQVVAAPAASVDDLLVGQYRLVERTPVDRGQAPIRESALPEEQEQRLRPPVVVGQARRDLARPVVEHAHHRQLPLGDRDVAERQLARMLADFDGRVLGRHPERVPAERVQHLHALHAAEAADKVPDHVVAHVAHVQLARRVREHDQVVVLRPVTGVVGDQHAALGPDPLPFRLDVLRDVAPPLGDRHQVEVPILRSVHLAPAS